MQPNHDGAYFAVVVCVPLVVRLLLVPRIGEPVRAWSLRLGERLWAHLAEHDTPDEATLQRWAVERLQRLRADLERVRILLLDDEWMSATRQVGNRLAYERLVVDVRDAEVAIALAGPVEVPAAPSPVAPPRFAFVAPSSRPVVEVIEFGPSGRWF